MSCLLLVCICRVFKLVFCLLSVIVVCEVLCGFMLIMIIDIYCFFIVECFGDCGGYI